MVVEVGWAGGAGGQGRCVAGEWQGEGWGRFRVLKVHCALPMGGVCVWPSLLAYAYSCICMFLHRQPTGCMYSTFGCSRGGLVCLVAAASLSLRHAVRLAV